MDSFCWAGKGTPVSLACVGWEGKRKQKLYQGNGSIQAQGEKISRLLGEPRKARRQEASRFGKAFLFLANESSGWVVLV